MATEVLMPKLGLTMTEGTIEEWKKKEGDMVSKGDVLFSVATDKLTNDVEADADGVLLKILFQEGETVSCKTIIAWIGQPGEKVQETAAPVEQETAKGESESVAVAEKEIRVAEKNGYVLATPYAKKLAAEKGYDLSRIKGTGPDGAVCAKDVKSYVPGPKASPVAAKMAQELGIDLSGIQSEGRIMKKDVMAISGVTATPKRVETAGNDRPPVKVSPLRRSIAANMCASWETSPRVTYTHPVDATAMIELRERLNRALAKQNIKISYNHIIMKASARALMEFPDVNASFSNNMLTRHIHANVGLAVAKGDGLIVPNVKECDNKTLAQIAVETGNLIEKTRNGGVSMEDITGGTFTVSSLAGFGLTSFSPIINQPELAILGVCDIIDTPVVRDGQIVIRPMMNLCLTADHRVIDGVMAAGFLKRIVEILEEPFLLLI